MNTERPENDDAAREPEETGSAEQTEKVAQQEAAEQPLKTPEATEAPEVMESAPEAAAAEDAPEAPEVEESAPDEETDAAAEAADTPGPEAADTPEPEAADIPEPEAADIPEPEAADTPEREAADTSEPEAVEVTPIGVSAGAEPVPAPRRRSPFLILSVAAAVLLVGGGGAYLSAQAAGGGGAGSGAPSDGGTPVPLTLDDYTGTGSDGGANGIAPGEPNPYGVTYNAAGTLPEGPGSAPVYWAKGQVGKDEVARLAKALGVDGTPVVDGEAWKVGAGNDGSGPVLRVNRQAPGMWTFSRYAPGTDACTGGIAKCTKDPAAPAADPVSEAAAKKAAAPILKAVGQDDAKVDAHQVMGAQRVVNADPEVGGLPTYGWTTGISVGADGVVVGGNGQLKAPVEGDAYPLLTAAEALKALNAAPGSGHRMGIGGCASPVPLKDRLESPCGSSTSPAETVTVEDAVLGLAPHTSGGRQVLVPSWLFDVQGTGAADAYRVTQPAVDPAYLQGATTPTPAPSATSGTRNVQVDGYTAEGKELVVSFTGGVCADYEATAKESGGQVTVTVTETPWPDKVCILIAKEYHRTVQLDEPLGSRKVVGSDGAAVPLEKAGARLPDVQ
ncbi:hypothetical protein ABZ464_01290 [Streptomyces sp. NPDC005820]|uniref:hypothetical protein n=1 Tax=Streptomyces sp. NPDC005820 TaxID=3157069 RepID=UPI0033DEA6EB